MATRKHSGLARNRVRRANRPRTHPKKLRRKADAARARKGKRETHDHAGESPKPDLNAILGRFADALSFVSTATHTLISAEDRIHVATRYDASETIHTLTHGLNELNRVYNDLDNAIMELS